MGVKVESVQKRAIRLLLQRVFCVLAIAALSSASLYGQGVSAAIQGTITDSTGAVIPGAMIAVTNLETGLQRSVSSNNSGLYVLPNLPPGRYRVQVSQAGFQTSIREDIMLVVGQQQVLNTSLQVGEVTQQVTVTEEAPLVDTTT
ncbi:MAG: carboxypeptidase-like regulatory domain-containing protein, partial [Terriglobia bacterium]